MRSQSLKSDSQVPKRAGFVCFNESPLKMIKNAFYYMLKALFVLAMFNFLSWLLWSYRETT